MGAQTCSNCGKRFYITSAGWGYAYSGKYTCSYRCMREMRENDVTKEQKQEIRRLLAEGLGTQEVAEKTGTTVKVVGGIKGQMRIQKQPDAPDSNPRTTNDLDQMVISLIRDMVDLIKAIYGGQHDPTD